MGKIYISDGQRYDVAEHRLEEFLQAHPDAIPYEVESYLDEDIEKLYEKAHQAQLLEELHKWATQAREIIYDILGRMSDLEELGFGWNGTLESIINTIIIHTNFCN